MSADQPRGHGGRWTFDPRPEPDVPPEPEDRDSDADVVYDLREFAVTAAGIAAKGQAAFSDPGVDGQILRQAARSIVINVAAAAEKLSDAFRDAHPEVPWRAIRGARNRVAHDYRGVRDEIVWTIIAVDIPLIVKNVEASDS